MRTDARTPCYLLRAGATREEEWTRSELEAMARAGEVGPDDRLYDPERDAWVPLSETDLAEALPTGAPVDDAEAAGREALRDEYDAVRERLRAEPDSIELLVEAGRLASELGDRAAASSHFQRALDARPFHPRVAREARQRLSPAECRRLRFLDRPDAPWDDLVAVAAWPLGGGAAAFVAPMALACALLVLVPGGAWWVLGVGVVLCALHARAAARGASCAPRWSALASPVRDALARVTATALPIAMVVAAFAALAAALARYASPIPRGPLEYLGASPVLLVLFAASMVVWTPAVVAVASAASRPRVALAPWRVAAAAARMGGEFVTSVLLVAAMAFAFGWLGLAAASVPGAGVLVASAAVGYAVPVVGAVAGRLGARQVHRIDARDALD